MTRRDLPVAVPCGVCLERITGWTDPTDDQPAAQPCGHTSQQIYAVAAGMRRVQFGQHCQEAA